MTVLRGIRFKGLGPFGNDENALALDAPITLMVGRNNVGKSCVIDTICYALSANVRRLFAPRPKCLIVDLEITQRVVRQAFPNNVLLGVGPDTPRGAAMRLVGQSYSVEMTPGLVSGSGVYPYKEGASPISGALSKYASTLARYLNEEFSREYRHVLVRRLSAERDILAESLDIAESGLRRNGSGASALVASYLNDNKMNELLIERDLLCELNKIMEPDASFERIMVQNVSSGDVLKWEIFLQEKGKDRFPLSASGSGLKTVILVLLNLLLPHDSGEEKIPEYYLFEELENNLHPSLQRRLFEYLYDYACSHDVRIVITSHSQTAINSLYSRSDVAIYAIFKSPSGFSRIVEVFTNDANRAILDDLGIKASDILQSNGIVWVEGPSDRVYVKAWLDVVSDGQLIEGVHYQFLYYGGKLLVHYTANEVADKIEVMFINRNSFILMDSDLEEAGKDIRAAKREIRSEFRDKGLGYWVTKGREIENYISVRVLRTVLGDKAPKEQVGQYESFPDYIDGSYKSFKSKKVEFARFVAGSFCDDDLDVLDLRKKINELYDSIMRWNS